MAKTIDITVPDLGDFEDVEIIEVLVSKGDTVEQEDGLITLETDKAAMDVPSPDSGTIEAVSVSSGDRVSAGDVIGKLTVGGGGTDEESPSGEAGGSGDTTVVSAREEPSDEKPSEEEPSEEEPSEEEPSEEEGDSRNGSKSEARRQTLVVPDIGDFEDVEIIEVHVSEGDDVAVDESLITLETDKAAMDVPAEVAGRIESVRVKVGDTVSKGDAVAVVVTAAGADDVGGNDAGAAPHNEQETMTASAGRDTGKGEADDARSRSPAAPEPEKTRDKQWPKPATGNRQPAINEAGFARAHASPSVRKLARELGVDLAKVEGSGRKDRVLHDDVKAFVKSVLTGQASRDQAPAIGLPQTPVVDFSKFGDVESRELTRIQKISGPRLQASWINLPHVTQHDVADITDLEARRQELKGPAKARGISLTPLAFVMKAVVAALQEYPLLNASLAPDGKSLVMKKYIHLGFAADTEQGLMVPVIRDADNMDVYELATELGTLSRGAREGKLKADQLQGASFTISSLGGIGGTAFTPIVNAPEVAILGVSRSTMQPVWNGSGFQPRLMLPLSLSYDHRVVDGAAAVRFTTYLGERLADVEALLRAIP